MERCAKYLKMQIIHYMLVANISSALVKDDIYADVGDTVNLKCNLTTKNSVTWLVPPNFQQYAVGNSLNTKLMTFPDFKLIRNIDSTTVLTILNFSNRNQGQYRCQTKEDDINFNVYPSVNPSNITIVNETTSKEIVALEGRTCQLICRVSSGLPKETLTWSHDGKVLAEGGPGNISYSFIPTRYDDGNHYTCIAYRNSTNILLMRNISVSVYFIPNVLVEISPSDTVMEGNSLVMNCMHDSNDKDATIRWTPECHGTLEASVQCRIDSVKRTDAGTYTCEVYSKVGIVQNRTALDILYAPDISIIALPISDSCICLECKAKGIPDVPVFANWQHKSSSGTPIRLLGNSSVLCIQPNSYKEHGIYICNVTNHIPNIDGEIWMQNAFNNTYLGSPYFTERNKLVQYAALKKLVKFYFYVVSGSEIYTSLPGMNNISISSKDIDDVIYDINVKVTGYEIMVDTIFDNVEDFGNYTIHLTNSEGTTGFEFEVKAADRPMSPTNVTVTVKGITVTLIWLSNFNGGFKQFFIVQFRKYGSKSWQSLEPVPEERTHVNKKEIDLQPSTQYCFRIIANNSVNSSEPTESTSCITTNTKGTSTILVYSLSVVGVVLVCVLLGICITKLFSAENPFHKGNQTSETILNQRKELTCNPHQYTGNALLNYVEVSCDPIPKKRKFVIHGLENRIPYADIDFTLTADPLSDSSSSSGIDTDDDRSEEKDDLHI